MADLCATLTSQGVESQILFLYGQEELKDRDGSVVPLPLGMKQALRMEPLGILRLRKAVGRWKPDFFHCHSYYAVVAAQILRCLGVRIPIVYTVHNRISEGLRSDFLIRRAASWSDRVVAVSHATAAEFAEFTGGSVQPLVVFNGIDLRRLELPSGFRRGDKRQELGIPPGSTVIATVAAFNKQKDYATLFRAFAEAMAQLTETRLMVVGDGPDRLVLRTMVANLGIQRQVTFLGTRTDVPELLAASDIFVLSTHTEGLPLAVIEAFCLGTPVVATDVGGVRDLRHLDLGVLLTDHAGVDSLRQAILSLADSEYRLTLANRLRHRAREIFDIAGIAAQYVSIYRALLDQESPRPVVPS